MVAGSLSSVLVATLIYSVILLGLYPPAIALVFGSLGIPALITAFAIAMPLSIAVERRRLSVRHGKFVLSSAGIGYLIVSFLWQLAVPEFTFPGAYILGAAVMVVALPSFTYYFKDHRRPAAIWIVFLALLELVGLTMLLTRYL